ncbi:uncharacterized protein [Musca autumnalis]|uniref:uncharacterized protein n=1 Tax=Musca autumnalis TaxID=221902 RepID=UPI003CEDFA63
MTKISADAIRSPHYFIPHHCVQRPESTTTKLRVVFDASAKTSSSHSLNDLMYTGPTVQSDLFSIPLRFRLLKYVFTTDVEKMYRQVLISPEDRQFQLIIWRKDVTQPITYYQLNTVTYGTRAAPYLATKCLQRLAKENAIRYPLASQFLQENFYVDDGLGGADSLVMAVNLQQQLIQVMKDSGFNLHNSGMGWRREQAVECDPCNPGIVGGQILLSSTTPFKIVLNFAAHVENKVAVDLVADIRIFIV